MYAQFYAGSRLVDFPLFALVFFVAMFAAVVVRVIVVKRRSDFDAVSRLPLADDADEGAASADRITRRIET